MDNVEHTKRLGDKTYLNSQRSKGQAKKETELTKTRKTSGDSIDVVTPRNPTDPALALRSENDEVEEGSFVIDDGSGEEVEAQEIENNENGQILQEEEDQVQVFNVEDDIAEAVEVPYTGEEDIEAGNGQGEITGLKIKTMDEDALNYVEDEENDEKVDL